MDRRNRKPSKSGPNTRPAPKGVDGDKAAASRFQQWIDGIKKHPTIIVAGAAIALVSTLAGRIGDVEKLSKYVDEWRNQSRLVRPYPNRLKAGEVATWSSGQTQLAILQIQGYLGAFKDGPRSVQLCLSDPVAFPGNASTQLNKWSQIQPNDVDNANLTLLNDRLETLDRTRLEDEKFLPVTNLYARLLARGSTQLFYGNTYRSWGAEFDAVPKESLFFLRNGLFARHGRPFSGSRTRRFFNRRSWYSVDPHFAESRLNAVEICNAYFLKERYPGLPVGSWGRGIRLVLDPQLPVGNLGDLLCNDLDSSGVGIECYVRNDLSSEALQTDFTDFELQIEAGERTSVAIMSGDAETSPEANPVNRQLRVSARSVATALSMAGLGQVGEVEQYRRRYSSLRLSLGPAAINTLRSRPETLSKLVPSVVTAIKDIFTKLDTSLYEPADGRTGARVSRPGDGGKMDPPIVSKPLTFDQNRRNLSLQYIRSHYGVSLDAPYIVPRIVVVHWTGVDTLEDSFRELEGSTLSNENSELLRGGDLNVSAHFLVDRDGTIYQLLPETAFARHAIGLNLEAIGVENVGGTPASPLTSKQCSANASLIRALVGRHPIEWLVGHYETNRFRGTPLWRENDSGYLTVKRDPGEAFMRQLRAGVSDLGLRGAPDAAHP